MLEVLNSKNAEKSQSTAEPFIAELLCGTLRETLQLSAVRRVKSEKFSL